MIHFSITPKLTHDMNENKQNTKTENSSVNSVRFSDLLAEKYKGLAGLDPLNVPAFGTACKNKIIITDEPHAIFLAKKMSVKYNREQEHYQCSECNHWHLTSVRANPS